MSSPFDITEHTIGTAHIREFAHATSNSQHETLVQHVKQYTPKDNPNPQKGDITIIGGHANGFPKELYEPLYEDLYLEAKSKGLRIRSILIADAAWQGRSGRLNKGKLGNDPSWLDYARDIGHMINTFRPPPPLVGMGHSFGAAAMVNASLFNPRLFSTLVLLDPVISQYASTPAPLSQSPAGASAYRRDVWPSREVAAASFAKSPFYKTWDKRALERWIQYGLVEGEKEGEVVLLTSRNQEVFTFLRPSWPAWDAQGKAVVKPHLVPDMPRPSVDELQKDKHLTTYPFYRPEPPFTLTRLPHVRPSVFYVLGGKSNVCTPELQRRRMEITGSGLSGSGGAKEGRVAEVIDENSGHLVPMENPRFCSQQVVQWVKGEVERWWEQEQEYEVWASGSEEQRTVLSEEFKNHIGKPAREPKAKI